MHKKGHAPQTTSGGAKASAFRSKGFRLADFFRHDGISEYVGSRADVNVATFEENQQVKVKKKTMGKLSVFVLVLAKIPMSYSIRSVTGYCNTNRGCNASSLNLEKAAINSVSVLTYHPTPNGTVVPCAADYAACTWLGSSLDFNARVPQVTGGAVSAMPLLFENDGTMIEKFRAMVASPESEAAIIKALVKDAVEYGYAGLSVDLEPSCWNSDPTACAWPSSSDSHKFRAFLDALAIDLAAEDKSLSVAVAAFPPTQCSRGFEEYEAFCADEESYLASCSESGAYNVSLCNCCAFTTWFNLKELCSGAESFTVVNMDTYMDAPFNPDTFKDSMSYYRAHGCGSMAVGLLLGEGGSNRTSVDAIFRAVGDDGAVEQLAIWVDIWANSTVLELWKPHLEAFLSLGSVATALEVSSV